LNQLRLRRLWSARQAHLDRVGARRDHHAAARLSR